MHHDGNRWQRSWNSETQTVGRQWCIAAVRVRSRAPSRFQIHEGLFLINRLLYLNVEKFMLFGFTHVAILYYAAAVHVDARGLRNFLDIVTFWAVARTRAIVTFWTRRERIPAHVCHRNFLDSASQSPRTRAIVGF